MSKEAPAVPAYGIRSAHVVADGASDEVRELSLVAATDRPVLRHTATGQRYYEQLDHSSEKHLSKIRGTHGAALLVDHERSNRVGVVRAGAVVDDNGHRATIASARLSRRARARELAGDVADGIVGQVSIGYAIRAHKVDGTHDGLPLVRVTDWEIDEVSLLDTIPPVDAEARVLAARGVQPLDFNFPAKEQSEMIDPNPNPAEPVIDEAAVRAEAATAERERVSAILALGATHNLTELAQRAITDGSTVDAVRASILDELSKKPAPTVIVDPQKDSDARFSVGRAVRGLFDPKHRGVEFEIAKDLGAKDGAVVAPWYALRATTANMLGAVPTDARIEDAEAALRESSLLVAAGAVVLPGLQGNVDVPVVTGAVAKTGTETAVEGGETGTEAAKITLSPKQLRAFTAITRTLMIQSAGAVEALIRDDVVGAVAEHLDAVGLAAIITAASTPVAKDGGGDLYKDVLALYSAVEAGKVPDRRRAYVATAAKRGALALPHPVSLEPIFDIRTGAILGTPSFRHGGVTNGGLLYGEFSYVVVGLFGPGVELSLSDMDNAGNRSLRAFLDADVKVKRGIGFKILGA